MPYQLPTVGEVWQMVTPKQRRVAGWILISLGTLVALFWVGDKYQDVIGRSLSVLEADDSVKISPFEWAQAQEDKRHIGEECIDWDDAEDGIVCRYYDGCIMAKHVVGQNSSHIYKMHPDRFGTPPTDDHEHGMEVSSAGFGGGGGQCIALYNHGGNWVAETEEGSNSRCYTFRFGRLFDANSGYTDGCVLRVTWNACNLSYVPGTETWIQCYH